MEGVEGEDEKVRGEKGRRDRRGKKWKYEPPMRNPVYTNKADPGKTTLHISSINRQFKVDSVQQQFTEADGQKEESISVN